MANNFAAQVEAKLQELRSLRKNIDLAFQGTLYDLGESLVSFTPLDTGVASSNWNLSLGTGHISVERDPGSGQKGTISMMAIYESSKDIFPGQACNFNNPVDYTSDLEDGTSRQAPAGMITPTKFASSDIWLENLTKYNIF